MPIHDRRVPTEEELYRERRDLPGGSGSEMGVLMIRLAKAISEGMAGFSIPEDRRMAAMRTGK